MKGFLLLLYCAEILSAQLCGAEATADEPADDLQTKTHSTPHMPTVTINGSSPTPAAGTVSSNVSHTSQSKSSALTTTTATTTTTNSANNAHLWDFYKEECLPVTIVAGGLILVCAILLLSTLMLACKVCRMSRHLKKLKSNSENCTETFQKDKSKSEEEAKESTMLMYNIGETQEDLGNGTTKEAGGKGNDGEQTAGENKKEVGGAASGGEASTGESKEETPAAGAENPSTCQPQEDATKSPSSGGATSSSEGTEDPKDMEQNWV